jgi:hypothetical protein
MFFSSSSPIFGDTPGRESCRDLATLLTTHKPVGIVELVSRTVVDELPQDALLRPAPTPGLRPGTRHQVQSPKILLIKGTVPRDFRLLFFFMNQFPQAPEYKIKANSNFFKNSQRYLRLKVHHWCR